MVYIFSGLGADERVFSEINWEENAVTFIPWIKPGPKESIEHYALRLSQNITTQNPVLLGISFGGMMAVEVSKHIQASKVILISSAKTRKEIPWYFKLAGKLGIDKILPASLLKSSNFLTFWFFGAKTGKEKNTLRTILKETEPVYLKWAINQVLNWKNSFIPENTFHIHGTKDRILPIKYLKCDIRVDNGRHFMILSQSKKLNLLILNILRNN